MMIFTLLPYLQWKFTKEKGNHMAEIITKWFKLAACLHTIDAHWDPWDRCVKNTSDKMLEIATTNTNDFY